jgi:hypothetical protein
MARTRKTQVRTNGRQTGHLHTNAGICISLRKQRIFKQGQVEKKKTKAIQQHVLNSAKIELLRPRAAQQEIADCLISFGRSCGRLYPFFSSPPSLPQKHVYGFFLGICKICCFEKTYVT